MLLPSQRTALSSSEIFADYSFLRPLPQIRIQRSQGCPLLCEDSYATADVAQSHSFQDAILPIAQVIIEHLNNKVINFYAEGFSLSLADDQPTKEVDEANRANVLYQGGIATRNEGRQMVGLSPIPDGERFVDNESHQTDQDFKTQKSTSKLGGSNPDKKKKSKPTTPTKIAANAIQLSLF